MSSKKQRTQAQQAEYDEGYRDGGDFYINSQEAPERPDHVHPSAVLVSPIPDMDELLKDKSIDYCEGFEDGVQGAREADE